MNNTFSLGHDPEFLVTDVKGRFVCPKRWLAPLKQGVESKCGKGGFNRDGMAVELNPNPSYDPSELFDNTESLFREVSANLKKMGYRISEQIGGNILQNGDLKTFSKDVLIGGCSPDYNAYKDGEQNNRNIDYKKYPFRYCGGHIHIGIPLIYSWNEAIEFIRIVDSVLFKPLSEYETQAWSKKRREAYGQPGDFRWRPEKNLIEYRTPDASWVWADLNGRRVSEKLFHLVDEAITQFRKKINR